MRSREWRIHGLDVCQCLGAHQNRSGCECVCRECGGQTGKGGDSTIRKGKGSNPYRTCGSRRAIQLTVEKEVGQGRLHRYCGCTGGLSCQAKHLMGVDNRPTDGIERVKRG